MRPQPGWLRAVASDHKWTKGGLWGEAYRCASWAFLFHGPCPCGSDSRVGTRTEKMEQVPTALSSAVIYERSTRRQFATAN